MADSKPKELFPKKVEEAFQFVAEGGETASDPAILLDKSRTAGFYLNTDNVIRAVTNNTDNLAFAGTTTDPGVDNCIFISGVELYFRALGGGLHLLG